MNGMFGNYEGNFGYWRMNGKGRAAGAKAEGRAGIDMTGVLLMRCADLLVLFHMRSVRISTGQTTERQYNNT
jgi:hypothetical protein